MIRYLAILVFAILTVACSKQHPAKRVIDVNPIVLTAEEQQYISTHRIVTWAVEDNRPPGVYVDDDGRIRGRVPSYLAVIAKKTGLIFRPMPVGSLVEAYDAVRDGHIDLITNVKPTEARMQYFAFTPPFAINAGVFLFRKDAPRSPLIAAIQRGDAAIEYLNQRYPGIQVKQTSDHEESFSLLSKNLVDVAVLNEASADYLMRKHNMSFRKVKTEFTYEASFGYSKDNVILGNILAKALNSISAEDKKAINDSWRSEKI